MDYKEIQKKNGEIIVFCDFEELIKEITGLQVEELAANLKSSGDEWICHCPFCKAEGHTKHKLYIKKDLSVGHCKVCGRAFVHIDDTLKIEYHVPDFSSKFYSAHGVVLPTLLDPRWTLDNFKYDFVSTDLKGEEYLRGRHVYLPEIAKLLDFKYNNGNIVIPFRYRGEVIYYQIRFPGKSKIKYYFPPVDNKPVYALDFGEGKRDLIICEGVFDAIALMIMAPKQVPIAVLGSSISDYQLEYLREYIPTSICIYMDETSISKRIASKIRSAIDYCPISIIPSGGEDPEENLKRRISRGMNLQWISPRYSQPNFNYPVPTMF